MTREFFLKGEHFVNEKEILVSIGKHFTYYFAGEAYSYFKDIYPDIEFLDVKRTQRIGREGKINLITYTYDINNNTFSKALAIKFSHNKDSLIREAKNSLKLEKLLLENALFSTPKFLFLNTGEPPYIVYEGIEGVNYDDIPYFPGKASLVGRLLAILHGSDLKKADMSDYMKWYRNLVTTLFSDLQEQKFLLRKMHEFSELIKESYSGANIFGDFHQSNIIFQLDENNNIVRVHVVDPEFMSDKIYERSDDICTFFAQQLVEEYIKSGNIRTTTDHMIEFLEGYESILKLRSVTLKDIYPKGHPFDFFIAQWILFDILDKIKNFNIKMSDPDVVARKKLLFYLLENNVLNKLINL